jgi:hypothetical protein
MPTPEEQFDTAAAAYYDNAGYETVAQCRAFITACRRLIAFPAMTSTREGTVQISVATVQKEKEHAQDWLNTQTAGSPSTGNPTAPIIRSSTRNFRD